MRPCVFFDRDGIVNRAPESRYVERWEDFHLEPGFVAALREVRARGLAAVVVTNQSGVGRGVMPAEAVESMHRRLRRLLEQRHGLTLTDVLYCPHLDGQCDCRKPLPGMLLEAARRHDLDLARSWMVGDQERDIEAGRRAGCRTVLVSRRVAETAAEFTLHDLDQLRELLRRELPPAQDESAPVSPPAPSAPGV